MTDISAEIRRTEETKQTERAAHKHGWRVAKYVFLTACGFILYRVGSAYAILERGYEATGGEVLLLLFPLLYYCIETMIRDTIRDAKAYRAAGKEINDHERQ